MIAYSLLSDIAIKQNCPFPKAFAKSSAILASLPNTVSPTMEPITSDEVLIEPGKSAAPAQPPYFPPKRH